MRLSSQQIEDLIRRVAADVPMHSGWRHYKGGEYVIHGYAFDTETAQIMVLYTPIGSDSLTEYGGLTYSRPASHWNGQHAVLMANTRRFTRMTS